MVFMKYLLSRTGLFPQYEPDVSDVLTVANKVRRVKRLRNDLGGRYWYVFPKNRKRHNIKDMVRLFRANGVLLHSHYSETYNEWVWITRDWNQQFMSDVKKVVSDETSFEKIAKRREREIARRSERFVRRYR